MKDFAGKVAVVTGAASGIGLSLARLAAERGMKVAVADIDEGALTDAAANLAAGGAEVISQVTDVRDPAAIEALRDAALDAFGTIHLVCNNAGVGGGGRTWEAPLEMWRWVLEVDLWSVIYGVRTFVPVLLEQGEGHIVNTASMAGLTAAPGLGPYNVAKHGVVALTETLAGELAGTGKDVHASVLCPAWVKTRIHEAERLAPDDLLALRGEITPEMEAGRELLRAVIESGLDPDDVARQVFESVETNRLYILTHPESHDWVRARADLVLGEVPTAPQ